MRVGIEKTSKTKVVKVGNVEIGGGNRIALIAGPCVLEDWDTVIRIASTARSVADRLGIGYIFKASYAKDNRSSIHHYYGPGVEEGTKMLERVKKELDVLILTDVHYPDEVPIAAEVADILQIPAFLVMQTRLTVEAGRTGKPINLKKSQFLEPHDMKGPIGKVESTGNSNILLTERGTFFGYHNIIVDFRSLKILREFGYPVIFDVTHTVRVYGIPSSDPRGGLPEFVPPLARAGVIFGIDAVFIETHPEPSRAKSDASSMLPLEYLEPLMRQLVELDELAMKYGAK